MAIDAQGRMHEPKGIPTGGQYAGGNTGHGVTDDLPVIPSGVDGVEGACDDWLAQPHEDDTRIWRMENGDIRDGRQLREIFARQVEADPDAYSGDAGELDRARMDDEYGTWFYENVQSELVERTDAED